MILEPPISAARKELECLYAWKDFYASIRTLQSEAMPKGAIIHIEQYRNCLMDIEDLKEGLR